MKTKAFTLVELLVTVLILGIVGIGLFTVTLSKDSFQKFSVNMPAAQQQANEMAMAVAGSFRRATLCTSSDSGCTLNAGMEGTNSDSVTVYARNSGTLQKVTYDVVGGAFRKTVDGTTTTVYPSGCTLALTYYTSGGYYGSDVLAFTPTSSTTPSVIGVLITATAVVDGNPATYSTIVRLRNGPKKITSLY